MQKFDLDKKYDRSKFADFLSDFLPDDFSRNVEELHYQGNHYIKDNAQYVLGKSDSLNLVVFEFIFNGERDPRVSITKEASRIMQSELHPNALVVFHNPDYDFWRLSLITTDYIYDEKDNTKIILSNPKRFSFLLGAGCKKHTPEQFLFYKGRVGNLDDLKARFSIDAVTKDFYDSLFSWYDKWAVKVSRFPEGKGSNVRLSDNNNNLNIIRLITRLMFVWFIKQKSLIPSWIFDITALKDILADFDEKSEDDGNYYNSILQNLFFATLNNEIASRCFAEESEKGKVSNTYGVKTLFRDNNNKSFFKISRTDFVKLFESVPYLNGGLFECLDRDETRESDGKTTTEYIDGFSREKERRAFVPNALFFGNEEKEGIIQLFERYNFTVEENSPSEVEVALDPELLGRVFENLLGTYNPETKETARKDTGSFYTPREIVGYMIDESLKHYLKNNTKITDNQVKILFDDEQNILNNDFDSDLCKSIKEKILSCRCADIACGSGAFPMGLLNRMVGIIKKVDKNVKTYETKLEIIKNCIYGVDIQSIAVQISKLRFFISLICEEEKNDNSQGNYGILTLPNLETKFVAANSLIGLENSERNMFTDEKIEELKKKLYMIRREHFTAKQSLKKMELRNKDREIREELIKFLSETQEYSNPVEAKKLAEWDPYNQNVSSSFFDLNWMFGLRDGFDIIIGNPPYISTKDIKPEDKKTYEKEFGFSDDTYNLFTFKGLNLLKEKGSLTYIIPKTFWTTQTKKNMRDKILSNQILYIYDTANPFQSVMVDTCIISVEKSKYNPRKEIRFLDGSKSIEIGCFQEKYIQSQNSVIFKPNKFNLSIYEKYGEKVKELYDKWWDKIETSKKIEKNKYELEEYRKQLKPGDIALLGCLTEGGQGLATANNGKYIAVRSSTKWADKIRKSRIKKLQELLAKKPEINSEFGEKSIVEFLSEKSEKEIGLIFDKFKEKYGRDVFGQGYLYKIIDDSEIANVDELSEDEKENGIDENKKIYVPYDKGDKDGNRWYLETPFAIAWSKENVHFFKTNSGKKGEGMPVLRNPQFYFKEGFCWIFTLNENSEYQKARVKEKTVNDVNAMALYPFDDCVILLKYFICLINSYTIFAYKRNFISSNSAFQINDARQLPIIIPSPKLLDEFNNIFDEAIEIKKQQFSSSTLVKDTNKMFISLQEKLDRLVEKLYLT